MFLSIVITTRNRIEDLFRCIESIKKSELKNLKWELIIVDDNSSDKTGKLSIKDLNIKVGRIIHCQSQQMMVKARNIGAMAARGKYILFIDDDNIVDKEMINRLVKCADENNTIGVIGPRMFYYPSKKEYMSYQSFNFYTGRTYGKVVDGQVGIIDSMGVPNVFLIRKEVFEECGYFDEKLIQTYSESDFSFRINKFGWRSGICQEAITYHNCSPLERYTPRMLGGGGGFTQKAYCLIRNRMIIVKRYGNLFQKIFFLFIFGWFWPLVYSLIMIKDKKWDLIKLYWLGFRDGIYYYFTNKIINSLR
jgi:GT2 family glycosyltransferase